MLIYLPTDRRELNAANTVNTLNRANILYFLSDLVFFWMFFLGCKSMTSSAATS